MAWSDAARKAAAEVRRRHAKTQGAQVHYSDQRNGYFRSPKRFGSHAFSLKSKNGAKHKLYFVGAHYSTAKAKALKLAQRVSAKTMRQIQVIRIS